MYKSVREFIDGLLKNSDIISLVKYGNKQLDETLSGESFSLCVIMSDYSLNVESVHFNIDDIPLDISIRCYNDLLLDKPVSKSDIALLDGEVIFDKTGIISRMLSKSREKWNLKGNPEIVKKMNKNEIEWEHFAYKHAMNKLKSRLEDELYSNFEISARLYLLVDAYMRINGFAFNEMREALDLFKDKEYKIFEYINEFFKKTSLVEKFDIVCKISDLVFKNSESHWDEKEILFLSRSLEDVIPDSEKEEIIGKILGLRI